MPVGLHKKPPSGRRQDVEINRRQQGVPLPGEQARLAGIALLVDLGADDRFSVGPPTVGKPALEGVLPLEVEKILGHIWPDDLHGVFIEPRFGLDPRSLKQGFTLPIEKIQQGIVFRRAGCQQIRIEGAHVGVLHGQDQPALQLVQTPKPVFFDRYKPHDTVLPSDIDPVVCQGNDRTAVYWIDKALFTGGGILLHAVGNLGLNGRSQQQKNQGDPNVGHVIIFHPGE